LGEAPLAPDGAQALAKSSPPVQGA